MKLSPATQQTILIALSAVNVGAVGAAANEGQALHAAVHAALALVFGLWAQRRFMSSRAPRLDEARMGALEADVMEIRRELAEAQERLDFAERMLIKERDAKRVEPGHDQGA